MSSTVCIVLCFLCVMAAQWDQPEWKEYALLDSGDGWKAERFGELSLLRPETAAIWPLQKPLTYWQSRVHAAFSFTSKKTGQWNGQLPDRWPLHAPVSCGGFTLLLEPTAFKHVGVFPEQASNWAFIIDQVQRLGGGKVLNLFAYTGAASLAARAAGADVTHVDSIRQVIDWTRQNMEASGLDGIRWVVEDALKFMQREVKRGNTYQGIIMDPPTWGLGTKGEKWRLEDQINTLFSAASALLAPKSFAVVSTYSGLTPTAVESLAKRHFNGTAEGREVSLSGADGTRLPLGNTLRIIQ